MKRKFCFFIFIFLLFLQAEAQVYKYLDQEPGNAGIRLTEGIENPVTVKIIYDNYSVSQDLTPDWGYAILITGLDDDVLFDTGAKPDIFESNFRKMNLDGERIHFLVLSHEHGDHTNGIPGFVKIKNNIPAIIPESFSGKFKENLTRSGLKPVLVKNPALITGNLFTSGEFPGPIPEQSLILNTKKGLVIMTGCSHPGIIEMLNKIKTSFNKNIYMVFGGFHLLQKSDQEMEKIIAGMKSLGVVKVGATHCTGEKQTKMIREAFKSDFFELGVGNSVVIN